MSDKKTSIENAVERLTANYRKEELFLTKSGRHLPVRAAIINIVKEMRSVIFPGYFDIDSGAAVIPDICSMTCLTVCRHRSRRLFCILARICPVHVARQHR